MKNRLNAGRGWLRRLVIRLLRMDREAEMRRRWLEIERAGLEVHAANLDTLKAWRHGNEQLQAKWTDEMHRRLDLHAELLEKWSGMTKPYGGHELPAGSGASKQD